ncbi:GATA transcription factor 29 [Glycine soja]|uniref:GATA transcription factor 29 n=1 Tax=Glycine soja TaxID=3848 RepID=A0A445GPA1_GLYSO|nr:GATA transcription factor 29 [Glycine soja]RZB63062.1 GATA transcription factor 29 [Glycine soja]
MDSGKTNEASNSKLVHDFDLNIAYVEEFDHVNAENEFSSPILVNTTQQACKNSIENMNIEDAIANNRDTTIQANSAAKGATSEDTRQVEPKYIASVSFTPARISQYLRRRRHYRGAESKQSTDPDKLCTNFYCKTRKTPMWRKGPLGPKTLCNACGLQYLKMVKGTGSGLPAAVSDEGDASVPAETVERDSNL